MVLLLILISLYLFYFHLFLRFNNGIILCILNQHEINRLLLLLLLLYYIRIMGKIRITIEQ